MVLMRRPSFYRASFPDRIDAKVLQVIQQYHGKMVHHHSEEHHA